MTKKYDILIIGAGVSGIGIACHLAQKLPNHTFAILERRQEIGGTWDLFRYPGIRSDSDMLTFGYSFRPWMGTSILADGPSIKQYVIDTAREFKVEDKIMFNTKVTGAEWNSNETSWSINTINESTQERINYQSNFLIAATGYYDYDKGYLPDFKDADKFKGQIVHPQHWPEELDYKNKKVVVIGSGATAVTIVPAMADQTAKITMLQRSPTYIYSVPAQDKMAIQLRKIFSAESVFRFSRWRNINGQQLVYKLCQRYPNFMRKFFLKSVKKEIGDQVDIKHFSPKYNPWEQRLAAVPDSDLFKAIKTGKASVVTDHIEAFTENGILLESGNELEADIIVTATGLNLKMMGGLSLIVDNEALELNKVMTYKGAMLQNMPNFAFLSGYTNSSWTLKVDIASAYIVRLLKTMKARKAKVVIPRSENANDYAPGENIFGSLSAGYVLRKADTLPRQGKALPWRVTHDYKVDKKMFEGRIEDDCLEWIK